MSIYMIRHIRRVAASCFWQVRQLWKIRRSLSVENAKTLVHALMASRIDFYNNILYRVAAVHLRPLQSVLNAAARLVLKLRKFHCVSISSMIRNELHWLPVHKRIVYKLCLVSTRAGPILPVVTLFAALSSHNPSSSAGSNPRRPLSPANANCHIRLTGFCSLWTYMLELTTVISKVTVAETCSFL